MRRVIRTLGFPVFLVSIAGLLWGSVGGPWIPRPSISDLKQALTSTYLPIEAVIRLLGLVGWLLWFYLLAVGLLRVGALVALRYSIPGARRLLWLSDSVTPGWLRRLLDLAIGGAFLLSFAGGPSGVVGVSTAHEPRPPITDRPIERLTAVAPEEEPSAYVVRPGDSLWRIAERELGDGLRWGEIYDINAGREMANGQKLVDPDLIRPGWRLELRRDDGTPNREVEPPAPMPDPQPAVSPVVGPEGQSSAPSQSSNEAGEADDASDVSERALPPRPIRIDLPDGGMMAGSFAAGILAASLVGKLRRRARREPGQPAASMPTNQTVEAITRAAVDPTVDVVGPMSEQVFQEWVREFGSIPEIRAAWERETEVTFLLDSVVERLPRAHMDPTGRIVTFEWRDRRVHALVKGPTLPRLRAGPFAAGDGLLVPVGFVDDAVIHLPLLGPPLAISPVGPEAEALIRTIVLSASLRLGPDNLSVFGGVQELSVSPHEVRFPTPDALRHAVELEVLRRRRLLSEEGAEDFIEHVMRYPDDQLPVIIVAIDGDWYVQLKELLELGASSGIAVTVIGDAPGARMLRPVDSPAIQIEPDSEPMPMTPAFLPAQVLAECSDALDGAILEPDEPPTIERTAAKDELSDLQLVEVPVASDIKVHCLGGWRIERDGEVIATGWRRKALELLGLLIANPSGIHKERIIDTLWPRYKPKERTTVERDFNRVMSDVRVQLRGEGNSDKIVLREDQMYRMDWRRVWVDAAAFEEAFGLSRRMDDPEARLREAVDLYRGEFCEGNDYWWKEATTQRLRTQFVDAAVALAEILRKRRALGEALAILDKAIQADKYAEPVYRRAMEIEAEMGRRDAIRFRLQDLESALAEIDLDPVPETYRLVSSLVRSSAAASPAGR